MELTLDDLVAVFKIVLIDIVLSGDNAVVIALAAHRLPERQRRRAILWGGGIAILLRVAFTLVMAFLLNVPGLRFLGGLVLVWIACKLLREEDEPAISADDAQRSAVAAIRMIFVADFVMSLDNMLAVAGASHGSPVKLLLGLFVSIGIIMTCSALIARLMNRYRWIVLLGAGILAYTAGEMIFGDRELGGYVVRNHHVALCPLWEEWMLTDETIDDFEEPENLPPPVAEVAAFDGKRLTFVGQMTMTQRDVLLERTRHERDLEKIEEMYEESRAREVPGWVPGGLAGYVERWFQRKWPAEDWFAVKDHRHYAVARIFYVLVVAFCLTSPYWWRRRKREWGVGRRE
jgi:YjbE family integral membrane protein